MSADPGQAWQDFAAQFSSPAGSSERFMSAARAFLASVNTASAGSAADPTRRFTDSVREAFAAFPQPWNFGFGQNPGQGAAAPPSTAHIPALGAGREHQARAQRVSEAWRRIEESQRRLQLIWSDAMREAAAAFAAVLASNPLPLSPEAPRRLYDQWIDCAEEAYSKAAHSETFCDALGESVNAASEWRKQMQASAEHSAKFLDLPTRTEINALTARVHGLEAELRALRTAPQVRRPGKSKPRPRRKAKP